MGPKHVPFDTNADILDFGSSGSVTATCHASCAAPPSTDSRKNGKSWFVSRPTAPRLPMQENAEVATRRRLVWRFVCELVVDE